MRDREPIEKISVPRLDLIDPVEHAGFLNSRSAEVAEEEVSSKEIQWIIDEMLRIAAGKGKTAKIRVKWWDLLHHKWVRVNELSLLM